MYIYSYKMQVICDLWLRERLLLLDQSQPRGQRSRLGFGAIARRLADAPRWRKPHFPLLRNMAQHHAALVHAAREKATTVRQGG